AGRGWPPPTARRTTAPPPASPWADRRRTQARLHRGRAPVTELGHQLDQLHAAMVTRLQPAGAPSAPEAHGRGCVRGPVPIGPGPGQEVTTGLAWNAAVRPLQGVLARCGSCSTYCPPCVA